jgi:hypothetical protein
MLHELGWAVVVVSDFNEDPRNRIGGVRARSFGRGKLYLLNPRPGR